MFDTHAHLNFKAFDGRVGEVIEEAKRAGVTQIVIPGTDIISSKRAVEVAQKYEGIYAAVGIHPHHVFEVQSSKSKVQNYASLDSSVSEISKILQNDREEKIVAIGEIGMDRYIYQKTKYREYSVSEEFIKLQKEYFVEQLKLAVEYKKSVIIHCREAKEELLGVLGEVWGDWGDRLEGKTVLHCCEPDTELLEFARTHNIYIGVDGDVTYSHNTAKQNFIKEVPLEMLVLETDAPYLGPIINGQKHKFPNTPANLKIIAEFIAKLKGESVEKIKEVTSQNAKELFKLQP